MLLLELALGAALLAWFGLGIFLFWATRGVRVLEPTEQARSPLPQEPRVSIIVAARNEEGTLPRFLESALEFDYSDYEVIMVDDDSTDATGVIADGWAARTSPAGRLKVIHNRELPPGWGGKVHALALAARAARGEWILATDADVVFHPATLRLAMGCALEQRVQLFSLVPELVLTSFWVRMVMPAFSFLLLALFPIRRVNDPRSPRAIAAGAFILMRREDFEALGGYERLRPTVVEDLRMAEMFKRSGRRIYVAYSRGLFRTRMYAGPRELWEGLTRSAFEGAGFSVAKVLGGVASGTLFTVLPWASAFTLLIRGHSPFADPVLLLALATCSMTLLVYSPFVVMFRVSPLYAFTLPLATIFYAAASLSSAWKSLVGGGVAWKGRRYKPEGRAQRAE